MLIQWFEKWHGRWVDLHPFWRFAIVMVVLAAGGVFGLKPAYRKFKGWRLERNLEAAKVAVTEVRMNDARDLSLTVLRAGDPRIEAFRILEQSMGSLRDPMHGEIARAMISHPQSSDEDRLKGFRGVVPEGPLGLVGQAWASLPARCQQDPDFAGVFAERLLEERRYSEAATVLVGVPESSRNVAVEQALIRVLMGSGTPQGYEEVQRRLAKQWPATPSGLESWLELLESIPVLQLRPALLGPVRTSLEREGAEDPARHALALARLDYAANFAGRSAIIEKAVTRWQTEAPVLVARFLCDLGLFQRVVETFPLELVATHPKLRPYLLEAQTQTGAWADAKLLLDAVGEEMPKCEMMAHQAVVAGKSGDTTTQNERWNAAMADAKFSKAPDAFLQLSRIARNGGMVNESQQAMLQAVLRGRGPLPLYADNKPLVEWLAKQGLETNLLQVCAIYLLFEPGNPVLLTQYAYLACLNSLVEPAIILKAMKPMAEAFPEALPIHCVLAVAYLSGGDAASAMTTLDRLKADPAKLAPGYRAAFLATLVVNGRIDRQDPRITDFPWTALLPSERKRFSEWLKPPEEKQ